MNRPVAGVNDGETLKDWFDNIPPVTKLFFVSTLLSGAAITFNLIHAHNLVIVWPAIVNKFHVWRLFTSFVYAGKFSFNFAMHTYVLFENCRRYEANPFDLGAGGTSADFLWLLISAMVVLLGVAYLFDLFILSEPLLYVIIYSWSRREPTATLNMFGFKFKSLYLPWVYMALRLVMGGSITDPLIGVAVGHLFFFLHQVLPVTHNINISLLKTPKFCSDIIDFMTRRTTAAGTAATPSFQGGVGRVGTAGTSSTNNTSRFGFLGGNNNNNNTSNTNADTGLRQRRNQSSGNQPSSYNWGNGRVLGST